VFHDKDGTVGGVPNSYILINEGIAIDEACEIKPTWNAAVCTGDIGRMNVGGGGGGGGRGVGGGRGAAPGRGGAAGPGPALGPEAFPARVGDPGAAGPGAPGGRAGAGRGAGTPAQPPIVLSRNGRDFTVTGATNVRAGTEITVTTERPSVSLTLSQLDRGSWVIFELPGFTTAASGDAVDSLDALRAANTTSYYRGNGSLWVKLVSSGDIPGSGPGRGPSGGASLQVSR
jgi:hypothetical protein